MYQIRIFNNGGAYFVSLAHHYTLKRQEYWDVLSWTYSGDERKMFLSSGDTVLIEEIKKEDDDSAVKS